MEEKWKSSQSPNRPFEQKTTTMRTPANRTGFVVSHRVERKTHNAVRQNCLGEAFLRRNKSWENSKFEALDSHFKQRRTPATTQSTTWLCSSEKRMQTIARRAPGKDPRRKKNHSSQSTSKTAKRTTIRGHRRIRLSRLTPKQVVGSTKGRGETCRQLRHRWQIGTEPIGRRAIGILSILQALTIGEIFLRVRTSFGCLEKNLQPTDGRCEQYTHEYSTVQSCTAWSHFITRTRVAQELQGSGLHIFVSLKQLSSTCHVSFFAAPDTDHKHKFSLTHLVYFSYLSDSLTSTHKIYPIFTLRCSTAEWRINTNPNSHKEWGTLQNYWNFPSQSAQIYGYVYHDTIGQNLGQTSKIQWFLLTKYSWSPACRIIGRKTIWASSIGTWMGNVPNWECLFIENKAYSYGCKETKPQSDVEEIDEAGWSGRNNIFSWPCTLKEDKKMFESRIFLLEQLKKNTWVGKTSRKNRRFVTRKSAWKNILHWQMKRLSSCTMKCGGELPLVPALPRFGSNENREQHTSHVTFSRVSQHTF